MNTNFSLWKLKSGRPLGALHRRHRRQHHHRCLVPSVSSGTAIGGGAVFLIGFLGLLSFLSPPLNDHPVNRSLLILKDPLELQRNAVLAESFVVPSGGGAADDLWRSEQARYYYGCSNTSANFKRADAITEPDRYLMIATSGGLNQQRTGITDAVVVARILNATLVVPKLDQKSFWKDASKFTEIFDVDWFIASLSNDVKIIKEPPQIGGKLVESPYSMRVPRKCSSSCYKKRVLPNLVKKHVVQLSKFDYRLSNKLTTDLQKLRCRVNYHALRYIDQIQQMGETLIQRMRTKSKHFIALHLRYEPDMLAFTGCYYGGGDTERTELGAIRKRWKTLHSSNPEKMRRQGRCPLKPEEIGLMLRALGFGKDVHMYVASGEVYGGEETLAPLKALFPNFHSKETLLSKEELAPFSSFSSRMAALDFIVCDGTDVFVTNNNGNMVRMLAGRRKYFGHKRTIRPNAKKLHSLFPNRTEMSWEMFASKVKNFQKGFMGEPNEVRPGRGEFHENPFNCICEKAGAPGGSRIHTKVGNRNGKDNLSSIAGDRTENGSSDEEIDWHELDYGENEPLGKGLNDLRAKDLSNRREEDYYPFIKSDEPGLEEVLSD